MFLLILLFVIAGKQCGAYTQCPSRTARASVVLLQFLQIETSERK